MEPATEAATRFAKQMIDFQRTMFENIFKSTVMFQDVTESAASTLLKQATWFPEEGKKPSTLGFRFTKKDMRIIKI